MVIGCLLGLVSFVVDMKRVGNSMLCYALVEIVNQVCVLSGCFKGG